MKEVATFYVGYLEKDGTGRYNVWPSNAHESFWKVKNPATDLAAIRYLLSAIQEASRRLDADADMLPVWQTGSPTSPRTRSTRRPAPFSRMNSSPARKWFGAMARTGAFPDWRLPPDPAWHAEYELGVKTFQARKNVNGYAGPPTALRRRGSGWRTPAPRIPRPSTWPRATAAAARRVPSELPLRPAGLLPRTPGLHYYLEGSGHPGTGVNEMLLQSWDGLIRVCPALPKAWAAEFKLLAMGGFEVAARARLRPRRIRDGTQPARRTGGPDQPVRRRRRSPRRRQDVLESADPVLRFPTTAGGVYTVLPAGAGSVSVLPQVSAAPNTAPKHLSAGSRRWIGRQEMASLRRGPPAEPNAPRRRHRCRVSTAPPTRR